jgi:hypothetical protein
MSIAGAHLKEVELSPRRSRKGNSMPVRWGVLAQVQWDLGGEAYGEIGDFVSKGLDFVIVQRLQDRGVHAFWERGEECAICVF